MGLRAVTDQIDVTSALPQPDKAWAYTDRAGHAHRYAGGYPTLTWVVDETYWCEDCSDEHTEGHRECPLCGERIEPGLREWDGTKQYIPGRTSYYLGDREISEQEYLRLTSARGG